MKWRFPVLLIAFFSGCHPYKKFEKSYTFRSSDDLPHYENLDYWSAHPFKKDPSDSISKPLMNNWTDTTVDVFFIHPTTFTKKRKKRFSNAGIDDSRINAKTDYSSILYQASVFNADCRIFAPRYRQAHISNFFTKDTASALTAFDIAYSDVKNAFDEYLKRWNGSRPIIIAGHSQGSFLAERLLKDYFENKPLLNRLVVVYIPGWPLPDNFISIPICKTPEQTGCICSWRTLKEGFVPYFMKDEPFDALVTNPLSWTTTQENVSRKNNKGSILRNYNKLYKHVAGARISNGLLFTPKPRFPMSFLLFRRNYHIADINFYYLSIRENVRKRISAFWKQ